MTVLGGGGFYFVRGTPVCPPPPPLCVRMRCFSPTRDRVRLQGCIAHKKTKPPEDPSTQSALFFFFFFIALKNDLERPPNLLKSDLAFLPKARSSREQTRSQSEQLELCARQAVARQAAPVYPQSELAFLAMADTLARTTYTEPLEVKNPHPSIHVGPP